MPIDFCGGGVSVVVPGCEFGLEGGKIGEASVEALAGESGEFDFGHIEPRAMFWRMVNL